MAQLLLEYFCEEIPARMQARAESDLARLMTEKLKDAGLGWDRLEAFSGPRRLGLVIDGLPDRTEDVREERKGPRVGSPDKAIEGFLRGAGLSSLDQCKIEEGKKGAFYVALIEKPGRATTEVIAEAAPDIAHAFPWPKSMKFGEGEKAQRWVRPLQSILCLFSGKIVETTVFGLKASNVTDGHRVHGSGPFEVSDFAEYEAKLRENGVILRRNERKTAVLEGARQVCADAGYELIEDQGLLEEVTGLVEHPVAVLGDMDPDFLDLPPEVITLTMKTHQKYFAVRDAKTGELAAKFVVLANQDAPDGGKAIALGNARVLSARLSDARHFWDLDRKTGLEAMAPELAKVTFHDQLGTVADKVERVAALARELAPAVGADPDLAEKAARLAKADLVSQMVYEFPELQGAMGRYYALEARHPTPALPSRGGSDEAASGASNSRDRAFAADRQTDGADAAPSPSGEGRGGGLLDGLSNADIEQIADAIRDHYKPQGPSDGVPTAPVSAAVALADKLDTLVGFWAIDEKPTGSKDPFALRRAALGVIRIWLDGNFRVPLKERVSKKLFEHVVSYHLSRRSLEIHRFEGSPEGREDAYNLAHITAALEAPVLTAIAPLKKQEISKLRDALANGAKVEGQAADQVTDFVDRFGEWSASENALLKFSAYHDEFERTGAVAALANGVSGEGNLKRHLELQLDYYTRQTNALRAEFLPGLETISENLLAFFADRLKVHLKDEGVKHDVIDAVFALGDDDLVRVTHKARALQRFLDTEDGAALLTGYRRAANILAAEEKKGFDLDAALDDVFSELPADQRESRDLASKTAQGPGSAAPSGISLNEDQTAALMIAIAKTAEAPEERALIAGIEGEEDVVKVALRDENFEAAMAALARLREPVDAFFEAVVVNAENPMVRRNRLLLLSRIRAAADQVADFSRLEG